MNLTEIPRRPNLLHALSPIAQLTSLLRRWIVREEIEFALLLRAEAERTGTPRSLGSVCKPVHAGVANDRIKNASRSPRARGEGSEMSCPRAFGRLGNLDPRIIHIIRILHDNARDFTR